MSYLVFQTNPLVSTLLTFATNLSYTVLLTTTLFTTLLSLLKSIGTFVILSTSIVSISAFKIDKSDFAANLDVSTRVAFFKWLLLHN